MKTRFGQSSFAAAVLCSTPLISIAQKQNIERLTLLPGPNLLSPARTTPTMMPSPMKLDTPPSILDAPPPSRFESAVPTFLSSGQGTLHLSDRTSSTPLNFSGGLKEKPRPSPESLRFDSTLESTSPDAVRFKFIPKRD